MPQPVDGLAGERMPDVDLERLAVGARTRRSPPQSIAQRSFAAKRTASRSAARPLPVPPVSNRSPGGRRMLPREDGRVPPGRERVGARGLAAGCGRERVRERDLGLPAVTVVAGRFERAGQRGVDEPAGALGGPQGAG